MATGRPKDGQRVWEGAETGQRAEGRGLWSWRGQMSAVEAGRSMLPAVSAVAQQGQPLLTKTARAFLLATCDGSSSGTEIVTEDGRAGATRAGSRSSAAVVRGCGGCSSTSSAAIKDPHQRPAARASSARVPRRPSTIVHRPEAHDVRLSSRSTLQ